jgi:hypothetical protein
VGVAGAVISAQLRRNDSSQGEIAVTTVQLRRYGNPLALTPRPYHLSPAAQRN